VDKNKKKNQKADNKKLTLEDLLKVSGGLRIIGDSKDEEIEYTQRKSRYPKAPSVGGYF